MTPPSLCFSALSHCPLSSHLFHLTADGALSLSAVGSHSFRFRACTWVSHCCASSSPGLSHSCCFWIIRNYLLELASFCCYCVEVGVHCSPWRYPFNCGYLEHGLVDALSRLTTAFWCSNLEDIGWTFSGFGYFWIIPRRDTVDKMVPLQKRVIWVMCAEEERRVLCAWCGWSYVCLLFSVLCPECWMSVIVFIMK